MAPGPQAQAISKLIALVAASEVFQARAGIDDPAQLASEKIHCPTLIATDEETLGPGFAAQYPFVVIEITDDAHGWELLAGGGMNYLYPRGRLQLMVYDLHREAENVTAGMLQFLLLAEDIVLAIVESAALDDHLAVQSVRQSQAPRLSDPQQPNPHWWAVYEITWGNLT